MRGAIEKNAVTSLSGPYGKPGVNFYGTIRIATSDDPVFQFIGKLFHVDELQLHVAMTPTMFAMETVLGIDLEIIPGKLWFREMGVGMKVVTAPPQSEISMFSTLEAKIGDDRLRFTGQLAVQQTKGVSVTGSLSMEGMWCDPFGIQGVAIGDLAAQVAVKPEFPWLDQLGVTGKLRIGRASALMAVLIDSNDPDKCIFVGDANDVKIPDIINTLCGPGIMPHELRDVLDQFELRSLKISVVPSAVYIGTFYFDEKGITIKVGITIMGWSGDLYLRVDYNDGINGYATIDPINIAGILEVRESRDEQGLARTRLFCCAKNCFPRKPSNLQVKAGTCTEEINGVICGRQLVPKVGPQIYLNISAYRTPELYLSGYASLLGISVEAFIHLQRNGLITDVRGAIWGLFQAQLKLRIASDLSYVYIRAEMRNDLFVRLRMEAVKAIHDFVHTSERALDEAMASVRAAQHEVDKLLDEVNRMRFVVRQEREAISRRLREAQDTLDGAQRNVNSLLNEIESTKRWYGSLPAFSWPWNSSKARDWIWVGPKLAGLYIAYGVATAALTVARWALQAADFLVLNIPIDMDPRIIALLAAHGIATLALTVAENGLAGTKAMVQGFAWVSEQVVRLALGELFDIRYALFEGEFSSAQSLMKVDMAAEIVFLRMNLSVQFTMDFGDIAGTASSLVRRLIAAHVV